MSVKLNPYLTFSGNAREVLEYYHKIFGGELKISTFGEFPNCPEGYEDKVMHGALETDDLTLMGSEGIPGNEIKVGDNVSLSLSGDDEDKLRGYFDKLSEGGKVTVPMEKQMWGDVFGMCDDKYGMHWLVNITQS